MGIGDERGRSRKGIKRKVERRRGCGRTERGKVAEWGRRRG